MCPFHTLPCYNSKIWFWGNSETHLSGDSKYSKAFEYAKTIFLF